MIYRVQRDLYKMVDDAIIRSGVGEIAFKIAKIKKGYYIYNKEAMQLGQILFDNQIARITVAEQGTMQLVKTATGFELTTPQLSKEDLSFKKYQLVDRTEYTLVGDFDAPIYDVYSSGKAALNVLPDYDNLSYFRIRICDEGNLIFLVMLAVAINKLNNDPLSKL